MERIQVTGCNFPNLFSLTYRLLENKSYSVLIQFIQSCVGRREQLTTDTAVEKAVQELEASHG